LGGVRQRLDIDDPEFQFPILEELRANGGTDYVAMPLPFSDGQFQTMTLATDRPEGFSIGHLGRVFESIFALGRFYEVLTLRRNTTVLFDTYLGQRTRHQVLGGLTQRGDGEDIRAAILYCDLRDSTTLAGSLARESYLDLLNDFFERAAEPVLAQGGEVLKFIGDAVLAIFPLEGDQSDEEAMGDACRRAREAAQEIVARIAAVPARADRPPPQCAIGLHFGDVMYGNVGAPKRLDFTVIGTAANVAARLSAQCKELEQPLLMSAEVARHAPENLHSLGLQQLRHVAQDLEVFVVAGGEFG
jgi:class 3 adenylate cyclase